MKFLKKYIKKYPQLNNKHGVTITELLVVIAVIGVTLIPASTALMNGLNTYAVESDNMGRIYDAQGTLDYITDRVRFNADHGVQILDPSEVSITDFDKTDVIGQVLVIDNTAIYRNLSNQIREFENNTSRVLLKNARAMTFDDIEIITKENKDILSRFSVAITLEKRDYGNETFETMVYLRNK